MTRTEAIIRRVTEIQGEAHLETVESMDEALESGSVFIVYRDCMTSFGRLAPASEITRFMAFVDEYRRNAANPSPGSSA